MKVKFLFFVMLICSVTATAQVQQDSGTARPVSQREIDDLKRQILDDSNSGIEAIGDYHHETGDLNNQLDFARYGGRVTLKSAGNTGIYLTGTRSDYMPISSAFNQWGVNMTAGVYSKFSEQTDIRAEAGATRFSTDTWTWNGAASIHLKLSDQTGFYLTGSRENVLESLLSTTGLRPVVGPFAGQLVGRVMENRVVFGGSSKLPADFDAFGEGGVGTRSGSNVPSNFFQMLGGGVGYTVFSGSGGDPISLVHAGYELHYFGFADNRFGFGGASLLTRTGVPIPPARLGADFISPNPGVAPGVGGYFSPHNFVSNLFRGEIQGGSDSSLGYRVTGFIGTQDYTGSSLTRTEGVAGTVTVGLTERISLPISYAIDNYGPFTQQTLSGRFVVRF
jgi:hypothetical protein